MIKIPAALMHDKVIVKPYQGSNAYKETFGNPYEQSGRLETKTLLVKSDKGFNHVWRGHFFTDAKIPVNSEVVVSSKKARVESCEPIRGFGSAVSHYEVVLV